MYLVLVQIISPKYKFFLKYISMDLKIKVASKKDLQYVFGEFRSEMIRSKMSEENMSFIFFQINLVGDIPLSLLPKRDDTAGWN